MNQEFLNKHQTEIDRGQKVENFLLSEEWQLILKPLIEDMVRGIQNINDIKLSSDIKATAEIKGRQIATKYLESIETALQQEVYNVKELIKLAEEE